MDINYDGRLHNMGWLFEPKNLDNTVSTTKGTDMMGELLLDQYQGSTNLREYFGCFFQEMDELFENIERVYLGRFLEYARGEQLDIIGEILQQPRNIPLTKQYFGFAPHPTAGGMIDEAGPTTGGGEFISADSSGYTVTPLSDGQYKRLLQMRAYASTRDTADVETTYTCISILLGKVPRTMELIDQGNRQVELKISDILTDDWQLIVYATNFIVPTGVILTLQQV
jgi:hypothetical protein